MSKEAVVWAGQQRPPRATDKSVLWALADCAARGGQITYPSVAWICEFSILKRQVVIDCLARLARIGLIEDTGDRIGRTRQVKVWRLCMSERVSNPDPLPPRKDPDFSTLSNPERVSNPDTEPS